MTDTTVHEPLGHQPTLASVAQAANVSVSTASRALRNHPHIALATRVKVQAVAKEIGYSPNPYISTLMAHLRATRPIPYQATLAYLDTFRERNLWKNWSVQRQFFAGAASRAQELGFRLERIWAAEPGLSARRLQTMLRSRGITGLLIPPPDDKSIPMEDVPLKLKDFVYVTLGCKLSNPLLHFASNDQFFTAALARAETRKAGYRRIGFVVPEYVENIVENRFSAGFASIPTGANGMQGEEISILRYDRDAREQVLAWFREFQPDCVCSVLPETFHWFRREGIEFPRDAAYAVLDWEDNEFGWAGVDQNSELVGAASVDLLVQLIQRNATGSPDHATGIVIEGEWKPGRTLPLLT